MSTKHEKKRHNKTEILRYCPLLNIYYWGRQNIPEGINQRKKAIDFCESGEGKYRTSRSVQPVINRVLQKKIHIAPSKLERYIVFLPEL